MSSNKYGLPLRIEIGASNRLRVFVIAAHTIAMGSIPMLTLVGLPLKLLAAVLVVTSLVVVWRQRTELNGGPLTLIWAGDGQWLWQQAGLDMAVRLQSDSYVTPHLLILNFRGEGRWRRSVVLPGDNADSDSLRRLRVRLKSRN